MIGEPQRRGEPYRAAADNRHGVPLLLHTAAQLR